MTADTRFDNALRRRGENHPHQTALTPAYLLDPIREALGGIELDPCTTPDNPVGAARFYTPPVDGIAEPWDAATIYVNPPYGQARDRWADRCIRAARDGTAVILLMPAATDTVIFQRAAATSGAVVLIRGRVKFGIPRDNGRQLAASHPSALMCWNVPRLAALSHLGLVAVLPDSLQGGPLAGADG